MARRRQHLLESGTPQERAFYARNGVPLEALVAEGLVLVRMLDGVEAHGGSFEKWALANAHRPYSSGVESIWAIPTGKF